LNQFQASKDLTAKDLFASSPANEEDYLSYRSGFLGRFTTYRPKHIAAFSLTSMIKMLAQMRNLRRGHDTQGRVKRVKIDAAYGAYSNYMAPQRVKEIRHKADNPTAETASVAGEVKKRLDVVRPATDTYLTPEWDEMMPFPATWKLRFDGFGKSTYLASGNGVPLNMLWSTLLPDDFPPFYEYPGAPSQLGGSFAEPVCPCYAAGTQCRCAAAKDGQQQEKAAAKPACVGVVRKGTSGCGMSA